MLMASKRTSTPSIIKKLPAFPSTAVSAERPAVELSRDTHQNHPLTAIGATPAQMNSARITSDGSP